MSPASLSIYTGSDAQDKYFASFDLIKEKRKALDFEYALDVAVAAIRCLPVLVDADVAEFGSWEISRIPPIEYACHHLSVTEDVYRLRDIRQILAMRPELTPWVDAVDNAIKNCALMARVRDEIHRVPGVVQRTLGKTLHADGREVTSLLYYAAERGLVKREKHRNSYRLYIVEQVVSDTWWNLALV